MSLTLPSAFRSPIAEKLPAQEDAGCEQRHETSPAQILLELAVIDASLEAHRKCLSTLERIAADLAKIKAEAGVQQ